MTTEHKISFFNKRFYFVLSVLLFVAILVVARMLYLTIFERKFLLTQGAARYLRVINIPAYRGMILDRNSYPLAISTPVDSVWLNPQDFPATYYNLSRISKILQITNNNIVKVLARNKNKQFVYLKRLVNPDVANSLLRLGIPGIYLRREYRRYYPLGEVTAQVLGFTNIDDQGQEGLELEYNSFLAGTNGKERVLKDLYGNVVGVLSDLSSAVSGNNITLSLDEKIQFLAYRVLKKTVMQNHAKSGTIVVLDAKNGEILAMVNQPSFNPNKKNSFAFAAIRNRAVTDLFEPGSTMKAFSIASALESGKYKVNTLIDTNPGKLVIDNSVVRDDNYENHGVLTVEGVLQKSSNIGVAKMTLSLPPEHFLDFLARLGFGFKTESGFPAEAAGTINDDVSRPFVLATLSFGYGISVTPIQLAHAYSVLANNGTSCPVTFIKREQRPECRQVLDKSVASKMLTMLKSVLETGGTGTQAKVRGYTVAGKTGTARIADKNGYNLRRRIASFVGITPVSNPQLVIAVIIREPLDDHYGGTVAAPAFAEVAEGALRILNIPPDKI